MRPARWADRSLRHGEDRERSDRPIVIGQAQAKTSICETSYGYGLRPEARGCRRALMAAAGKDGVFIPIVCRRRAAWMYLLIGPCVATPRTKKQIYCQVLAHSSSTLNKVGTFYTTL